jgi:hypothetical protein
MYTLLDSIAGKLWHFLGGVTANPSCYAEKLSQDSMA